MHTYTYRGGLGRQEGGREGGRDGGGLRRLGAAGMITITIVTTTSTTTINTTITYYHFYYHTKIRLSRPHLEASGVRSGDRVFQEISVPGNARVCGSGKATAIWSFRHCKPAACILGLTGASMRLSLICGFS